MAAEFESKINNEEMTGKASAYIEDVEKSGIDCIVINLAKGVVNGQKIMEIGLSRSEGATDFEVSDEIFSILEANADEDKLRGVFYRLDVVTNIMKDIGCDEAEVIQIYISFIQYLIDNASDETKKKIHYCKTGDETKEKDHVVKKSDDKRKDEIPVDIPVTMH